MAGSDGQSIPFTGNELNKKNIIIVFVNVNNSIYMNVSLREKDSK